jgi:hypothetical protein
MASPHFRHGRRCRNRYLASMPVELRDGYLAALDDDDLTSLRDELALLTVRVNDLLGRLSSTPVPPWDRVLEVVRRARSAQGRGKDAALAKLDEIVTAGADAAALQSATWAELRELVQERTRTSAAEAKRMHDLGAMIESERALAFVHALMMAAKDELADDLPRYRRIAGKILAMLPAPERGNVVDVGDVGGADDAEDEPAE